MASPHHPSPRPFTPYVSGLDIEAQQESLRNNPRQQPISIVKDAPRSTRFCINFGSAYISLFSSFVLILSIASVSFAGWALHYQSTTAAGILLAVSVVFACVALFVAFRNMCFHPGHIISLILVSALFLFLLVPAFALSIVPARFCSQISRFDLNNRSIVADTPTSPSNPVTKMIGPRSDIGIIVQDNRTIFLIFSWIAVTAHLIGIIYLGYTYDRLRKRQYFTKITELNN